MRRLVEVCKRQSRQKKVLLDHFAISHEAAMFPVGGERAFRKEGNSSCHFTYLYVIVRAAQPPATHLPQPAALGAFGKLGYRSEDEGGKERETRCVDAGVLPMTFGPQNEPHTVKETHRETQPKALWPPITATRL